LVVLLVVFLVVEGKVVPQEAYILVVRLDRQLVVQLLDQESVLASKVVVVEKDKGLG
jgi:protein-tyrosine phosphatase